MSLPRATAVARHAALRQNQRVSSIRRVPPTRGEPREVIELRRLKASHPELAAAADLQIALLDLHRRVKARVPLPPISAEALRARQREAADQPLLRFGDIPLDWTDLRLLFREAAALLQRHEEVDEVEYREWLNLAREGHALEPLVAAWYNQATGHEPGPTQARSGMLDQVIQLAMRPFLARCAEALLMQVDLTRWRRGRCPLCGGEPELATITPSAERLLICGRCTAQWPFDPLACPFCGNADRRRITSFASRDGRYRIYACDACRRYLKAYDGRAAERPVMLPVDTVATLPLDAAAMQRGYQA